MLQSEADELRGSYLALVDKYWRELTLRDALTLSIEYFEEITVQRNFVKEPITFS
jgi:hypothetical protein